MFANRLLYPMLGTGGFVVMFVAGFSAGHHLGLHFLTTLVLALLAGGAGASLIARLEHGRRGR